MADEFKKAIHKAVKQAVGEVAQQLTEQIQEAYHSVITKFYEDYEPRVYTRTLATYEASSYYNENTLLGWAPDGDVAGIEVDPYYIRASMSEQPYRQPTAYVFERTFAKGIHGMTPAEAKKKSFRRKNVFGDEVSVSIKPPKAPMRPAPVTLMNKEFRRIRGRANIDPLINEAITRNLNKYL